MKKWEQFTKDELESFVKESTSINQVSMKCGYANQSGSGQKAIKEMIAKYNFDTSHFFELNGVPHNKGQFDYSRFQKGKAIKSANMIKALIALRGHKCECCNNTIWQGEDIPLEVHHKDGDSLNNVIENLQLLCPNCHAQTENYRNKNNIQKDKRKEVTEEEFKEALESSPNIRQALIKLELAPKGGNYTRANEIIAKYNINMKK